MWKPMQPSQRVATPMASAMSSLVLVSRAPGYVAARSRSEKACMVAGMTWRSTYMPPERRRVISG
jgi:hypothetical protein